MSDNAQFVGNISQLTQNDIAYDGSEEISIRQEPELTGTQQMIVDECNTIMQLLLEKNRKYGDSAVNPCRIFSRASAKEQILVRLDDKINRWLNQQDDEDEDVIFDMIGYLVLYRVASRVHGE